MKKQRPIEELGDRADWESAGRAAGRERTHVPIPGADSARYRGDITRYQDSEGGRVPREEADERGAWLPDGRALDGPVPIEERDRRERLRRDSQVSVKLTSWQFGLLESAADLYGISPTEMARLFINRGARAVLGERRREPGP